MHCGATYCRQDVSSVTKGHPHTRACCSAQTTSTPNALEHALNIDHHIEAQAGTHGQFIGALFHKASVMSPV